MSPFNCRCGQRKGLTRTNASRSRDRAYHRFVVHRYLNSRTVSHTAIILSVIANPITIVGIRHIIVVEGVISAVLCGCYLPSRISYGRSVGLNRRCGEVETVACANGLRRGRCGNRRSVIHMDLDRIADIAATIIAHFIMQVPVVISRWNILWIKGLISTILRLTDFPRARTITGISRNCDLKVITITNCRWSLQSTRDIGCNIHHQLTFGCTIDGAATAFHHVTDVPAVV